MLRFIMNPIRFKAWTLSGIVLALSLFALTPVYASSGARPYSYVNAVVGIAGSFATILVLVQLLRRWRRGSGGNDKAVTSSISGVGLADAAHSVGAGCGSGGDAGTCGGDG
jgi:hypothetical protein